MQTGLQNTTIEPEVSEKYSIVDNSFIIENGFRKNRITAEIGDTKDPNYFQPQFKILRHGNESNISFRLVDDTPDMPVITTSKDAKIKYEKDSFIAEFYDLSATHGLLEAGGYEFEITLKTKPKTNKIKFSLKTKNLIFQYQPALTIEERNRGYFRPDNIIGSYAVYREIPGINYVGGKLYGTNKIGHIPKPKIIDSKGEWRWGELDIDTAAEILTVTIPQDFLDSAAYPVYHAAGLTFGYTTIGGSTGGAALNYILAHPIYTPAFDGVAESLHLYLTSVGAGSKSTAGLYLAPTSYPTDRVINGGEVSNVNNTWHTYNASQEALYNGTNYRFSFQIGVTDARPKYDSFGAGSGYSDYFKSRTYTAGNMPDPFPAGASVEYNLQWSSYVTYSLAKKRNRFMIL